jgi:NAD(P)-dependent dehydrogenase (short-subunit alcohol dehydrogenase family)
MAVNGAPSFPYYAARLIDYNASKAALNMLTVQLAELLSDTPIAVNAACPGYVATDLDGHTGYLTPREGAATPVWLALLPDKAVNGRFMDARGEVAW